MFFTLLEYNIGFWPREYVEKVGNLVSYKGALWFSGRCSTLIDWIRCLEHDFGGHFAGLDNPPALIEDIREMGLYFK
jgi:hypothetical protein